MIDGMTDWIDKLKSGDDAANRDKQQKAELQLHRVRVVRAKAPDFWESLVRTLRADCERLNQTFRDSLRRQCGFTQEPDGAVVLQGHTEAYKTLRVALNLDALAIRMETFEGEPGDHRDKDVFLLTFEIDGEDRLYLPWFGNTVTAPAAASEALIRRVLNS